MIINDYHSYSIWRVSEYDFNIKGINEAHQQSSCTEEERHSSLYFVGRCDRASGQTCWCLLFPENKTHVADTTPTKKMTKIQSTARKWVFLFRPSAQLRRKNYEMAVP